MKRFLSFLLVSLLSISVFSVSAFAESDVIQVDSDSEYDSALDYAARLVQSRAVPAPVSDFMSVSPVASSGSSGSFVPSLTVEGKSYAYNSALQIWLDEVAYGQNVAYEFNTRSDGINQTDVALSQLNHKNVKFVLSGFSNDCTYTGVAYFQLSVKRASVASTNFNAVADYYFYDPTNLAHSSQSIGRTLLTDFLVSSISCKDGSGQDLPVYYSRILSSSGTTYTYTFYVVLQDYYVGPSNGVVDVDNVVVNVDFIMGGQLRYILNGAYFPLSYFALVQNSCNVLSRSFSGSVVSGRSTFLTDTINNNNQSLRSDQASLAADQMEQQQSLANAQMTQNASIAQSQNQLSESQHQDLVNGFDDSAGNEANKSLEDGLSSYESEEQKAHDDFNKAMDNYTNPDLSSYKSGFAFISSAAMSWWNALGMFKVILLVGFGLMIFNFISRYRGG